MRIVKENYYFVVLFIVCMTFAWIQLEQLSKEEEYVEIVVNEGDTLWGLAANYSDNIPVEHWISQVVQLNDLGTEQINSGELLRLPVKLNQQEDYRLAEAGEEAR